MKAKFWIIYLTLLAAGLLAGAASAQTPKPPDIPATLSAKFFKAHSESTDAQLQVINAQRQVDAKVQAERQVIAELQAACGEKFQPNMNQQGDVVCVAKPAEKPAQNPARPEPKPKAK